VAFPQGLDPEEEKKSYGGLFLLSIGMLLAVSLWSIWDDNISRRPWKKYQAEFSRIQYEKAKAAYEAEDRRLSENPTYQDLMKRLSGARESLSKGANAKRLTDLKKRLERMQVKHLEADQEVRFVKSELGEAWYWYDLAIQKRQNPSSEKAEIDRLERKRIKLESTLNKVKGEIGQIEEAIKSIHVNVKTIEDEISKLTTDRDRLAREMDAIRIKLPAGLSFARIPKIRQVVLEEFDRNNFGEPIARVDRCESCHLGAVKKGFENEKQPFRTHSNVQRLLSDSSHPIEGIGCSPCHEGQSMAVNTIVAAHGTAGYWDRPLLKGEKVQSRCITCHVDIEKLDDARMLGTGQKLFREMGCTGCHPAKGYEDAEKVGPYLRRIAAKVDPSWLVSWIKNPHSYRPRTRMPSFTFSDNEAVQIASFLLDQSKEESQLWAATHRPSQGLDRPAEALVAKGREIVEAVGCKGCHGFQENEFATVLGKDKDVAPALHGIAGKTSPQWIYHWLKNPRDYSPVARMPSLRLSDEEALAVTAYLTTLGKKESRPGIEQIVADPKNIKRGEQLVRKYGCFGCHDIKGMESESKIGVDLSTFGTKPVEELFFGNRKDIKETWDDWTFHKLKEPRVYATEQVEQLMPKFNLSDEDARALRVLLASFTDWKVPERYHAKGAERAKKIVAGRKLIAEYNCVGCHIIEGKGGAIRKYYQDVSQAPPILDGEGEKVQSEWLFTFLKNPTPLRPWLKVKMPTFNLSDGETRTIVDYFTALSNTETSFVYFDDSKIPHGHLDAARTLVSKDYFNCFSCHQQGSKKPEGPPEGWAPDLVLARKRLNPQWIIKWLNDPQKVQPGTKMPSYFPGGPDNIFGGNEEKQRESLRDYLMMLGRSRSAAADGK
jgi:mono/diheme cytochrome c family protein/predicted  nucleic acid-binding Zn-ribbon protein